MVVVTVVAVAVAIVVAVVVATWVLDSSVFLSFVSYVLPCIFLGYRYIVFHFVKHLGSLGTFVLLGYLLFLLLV